MRITHYPTIYQDKHGIEKTVIQNNGQTLQMNVRGVQFSGDCFHYFGPKQSASAEQLSTFTLFDGDLCDFKIQSDVLISVIDGTDEHSAILRIHFNSGPANEIKKVLAHECLKLELHYKDQVYSSNGRDRYDTFDEQLTELEETLPSALFIKICWTCKFSDYHFVGSNIFGQLACFRNTKEEYLRARGKSDLHEIWDSRAEDVQEIHLCNEYEKRARGSGLYIGAEYKGKRG